ncbi:MAG: hypothetical protein WDZ40_02335 [Candidatus Spechtbacterales bacterium]
MSNERSFDIDAIIQKDAEIKRNKKKDHVEMTLREYLDVVREDPKVSQVSPARLLELFEEAGFEEIPYDEQWLGSTVRRKLISDTLYGVEKPTEQVLEYLKAGANRLSTGKQILLLVGPTASGKSSFANIIKRALEGYNIRPVYRIMNCPMNEEPLHALPRYMRRSHFDKEKALKVGLDKPIEDELGISDIKGDLCPHCRIAMKEDFADEDGVLRWWEIKVETFSFSMQESQGIGSFEPSDEKSQDVSDLVGRENFRVTSSKKGYRDRNSFHLNGEIEKGNRGIVEGREFIKKGIDERILWVFINVAEEQEIKVQGSNFSHVSVDTVVVGHCNLTGYKWFSSNQAHEALHDRIYVVPFPYPLRVQDEIRVYEKLIQGESDLDQLQSCHICPGTFKLAASFAVLSRLVKSNMNVDPITKLQLYNGEKIFTDAVDDENQAVDIESLIEEGQKNDDIAEREGMFGVSSRDILAALNNGLVKEEGAENGCLTPLKAIRSLREVFNHRMGYEPEQIKFFQDLLSSEEGGSVIELYKEFILNEVQRAYLGAYRDQAEEIFDKYVEEITYDRERKRKFVRGDKSNIRRDPITGKPSEPDEKFMRAVEDQIPIPKNQADVFRGEILERISQPGFGYDNYQPLRRAVERMLLERSRTSLTLVLASDRPEDADIKQRAKDLYDGLKERGFCRTGAKEAVRTASEILNE